MVKTTYEHEVIELSLFYWLLFLSVNTGTTLLPVVHIRLFCMSKCDIPEMFLLAGKSVT